MNIFYLHRDPHEAARLQCDRHVVKMILETAQLLSTAHHELDGESPPPPHIIQSPLYIHYSLTPS